MPEVSPRKADLPWLGGDRFPLYLAPMAGYTDPFFRALCKRHGADVMITEFVLAGSIIHGGPEVWDTIDFSEEQRPMGVQIFGADADEMAEGARRIVERLRPDFVDLNFGCPADRVTCANAGSSLLRDLPRLQAIAGRVVDALPDLPVTGKIRIGWDSGSIVAVEATRRLEDAGVRAVAIHGRTKEQGYSGEPRWDVIGEAAAAVRIPVIGNGNVRSARDVIRLRETTGVRGLMVGRAALGYPWLFDEIKATLRNGKPPPPPSIHVRWETLLWYAHHVYRKLHRKTETNNISWMRSRLKRLTKDMPGCKRLRIQLDKVETLAGLEKIAHDYLAEYEDRRAASSFTPGRSAQADQISRIVRLRRGM